MCFIIGLWYMLPCISTMYARRKEEGWMSLP
jgi:hypothetical protein